MKIVNRSEYDTAEVRRLVRRALGYVGASDVTVTVKHRRATVVAAPEVPSRHAGGRYRSVWYPDKGEDREQIAVTLPRPGVEIAPYRHYERKREQGRSFALADWREALVAIVAHEGTHHLQTPRNGYGKRGHRYAEAECDLAAWRAVEYYREDVAHGGTQ